MKLLVISFCFPPEAMPRSIQVARLLRHLDGVETILVHGKDNRARFDPTIEPDAVDRISHRIQVPLPRPGWRRYVSAGADRLNLPLWNRVPDQYAVWRRPALRAVGEWWRRTLHPPDLLVTFGNPMTDHLIGLAIARRYGTPWIAHFSDPWVDNPYHRQHPLDRAVNMQFESAVVHTADRLAFPSEECADFVLRRYPEPVRRKAFILPAAFSPDFAGHPPLEPDAIVLRHIGEFYGPRTPKPLFQALRTLQESAPEMVESVRVEIIGGANPGMFEAAGIRDLRPGLVRTRPHVSHREGLELMGAADGLLLIDGPSRTRSIFLPSKLIEYIGVERPIYGIAPAGPAATLIDELGGLSANPSDPAAVADRLGRFIALLRERRATQARRWGNPEVRGRFSAPEVARRFSEEAASLIGHRRAAEPETAEQTA
ncbi:MAG TPA: glycosyltransferase [Gemmatimonadales bacterium]|nr:glycosyltransferase [Gemmatimonadales bacterium]